MLQDDFILRQIREMVHAVMKMLFQVSASELTPEVIEDSTARTTLENLIALTDEGKIDEAENQLYEMTCDGDRQNLEIGLLFYYNLNCGSIPHRNLIMPIREGFLWNQE